ncbi:MAG: hydrogen peroxide-inducible genes activator [Pseudomonadota bacterium]
MRLPTTKQLQYFIALVEAGHFGRAAEQSHVSQSAFSNAIRELENTLGAQLVDRTNRQVTITAIGREIASQARRCIHDLEDLVEIAGGQRKPLSGELQLGVIPTIAPFVLPNLLPKLRKSYPELKLYLTENQTSQLFEKLAAGVLDVLLLALPCEMRAVDVYPLYDDPLLFAYRKGSTRVDPEKFRVSRLSADSVLLLEDGHCLRDQALATCKLKDLQKVRGFAASSLLTLVEMVDADLGVTFLPEMAVGSAMLKSTKIQTQDTKEGGNRTIALAWRKGSGRSDEFRLLGDFITSQSAPGKRK